MTLPDLTVKDRIQLYLFDYNRYTEAFDVPVEVTQEAIAKAVGIRVHHVPQYVRPLMGDGLVEERTSHIEKQKRRRKAYFLSAKGRAQVAALRNSLLQETVPLRRRGGEMEQVPLSRTYHEDRRGATISELLQELQSLGYVLEVPEVAKRGIVDFSQEAPKVERFYGRERELAQVTEALERANLVVVTGMAGMGKTTLGAKVCEAFRGKRSLFWRQVRGWDTVIDLASRLAAFLKALGRTDLYAVLAGRGPKEIGQFEEPLAADLVGVAALFVFDDVQNASHEALMFLSILHRALRRQEGSSALILSRTVPTLYSRRDVTVDGTVVEVAISGLDRASSASILADHGFAAPVPDAIIAASGGNPLFLKLLASGGPPEAPGPSWGTLETFIAEEIEPALGDADRACLQVVSLYQIPVPPRGLLREAAVTNRTLVELVRKGLLTEVGDQHYIAHESIRNYFQQGLSAARRDSLAATTVPWLLEEADAVAARGLPLDAIAFLGNALAIEVDPARRLRIYDRAGDLRRLIGDFPGAIEAYRMGMALGGDIATKVRFTQKIAAVLTTKGDLAEAEKTIQDALRALPDRPSLERAWLVLRRSGVSFRRGDFDASKADLELLQSVLPGLPPDAELRPTLANQRALLQIEDPRHGDYALAKADLESALESFTALGDRRALCAVYNNLALAEFHLGEFSDGLAHLDQGLALAEETGNVPGKELVLFSKAFGLMYYVGDLDQVEQLYNETHRLAREMKEKIKLLWHAKYFADLYRYQGRFEEARESLAHFLANCGETVNAESRATYAGTMVRLCLECQDSAAAERYLAEAAAAAKQAGTEFAGHDVAWARAALLAHRGDPSAAEAAYEEARRHAPPWERGEFLLDYGRFLARAGQVDRAREVLVEARAEFERDPRKPLERVLEETFRSLDPRTGS